MGERVNGDKVVFRRGPDERVLLAVIDALGHGPGAEEVAIVAAKYLESAPLEIGVRGIMEALHQELTGTRGAAVTVGLIVGGSIHVCAVGNVELRCVETQIPFMFSPGIVGVRLPKLRICSAPLSANSRIVLFSDGISSRLRMEDVRRLSPADACRRLFEQHRRAEDDATVMIADIG